MTIRECTCPSLISHLCDSCKEDHKIYFECMLEKVRENNKIVLELLKQKLENK